MILSWVLLSASLAGGLPSTVGSSLDIRILSMRERAEVRDGWTALRLQRLAPRLMREHGIDMWLVISREYNEDPLFFSMAPSTWLRARRRTILLLWDGGSGQPFQRLAVSRYDVGDLFQGAWQVEKQPDQWRRLAELIREREPKRIGVSKSSTFALADGLSHSEYRHFLEALDETYRKRLVSSEALSVDWLQTRIPEEMEVYPQICAIAHRIIAEGFSSRVIQPGVTTTRDVEWWYRDRIRQLGLITWFHPSVSLQRAAAEERSGTFSSREGVQVIRPGDLLHVDFGVTYLGLNTDTQQHAYVLRLGERKAPRGLEQALAVGNRLQDILLAEFQAGRTGNQILARALEKAQSEGIEAMIYTHPIGFHGHGAGPAIGMWDRQGGVPGKGDYPLRAETAFSIELNAAVAIPEWKGKKARIMLEEDAFFGGGWVRYIDGRQTRLLLVGDR